MKTILLKSKDESKDSILIYDEIFINPNLTNNYRHCFIEGYGASFSLEHLVRCFKFPFKQSGPQFEVAEEVCEDDNLFALAEFYPFEEAEVEF